MIFKKLLLYLPYVVFAILIILVFTLFRSLRKEDNNGYKETLSALNRVIEAKDEVIQSKREQNEMLDKLLVGYEKRDSTYQKLIADLQPKYKANDKKLENIPVVIRSLSKDSLRIAAFNY